MTVPSLNLLGIALTAIGHQPVVYFRNLGRATNAAGFMEGSYAAPAAVHVGSVQAVPRTRYSQEGLDLSKDYVNWFVPQYVLGVARDAQGDQFNWNGKRWQVESITDWNAQDGWVQALAVAIGATTP